jgi:hypothetical protein
MGTPKLNTVPKDMVAEAKWMKENFTYKPDGMADEWDIGKTVGDCDDYVLKLLQLLCGGSKSKVIKMLLKGKARIIYTKTKGGVGHAVLEYRGFYICSRYQTWSSWRPEYTVFKPYSRTMLALKLALGKVI